ncbi:hypothetical protein CR62_24140 [Serratia grimesii]|uniref:Ead/Ea22-like protein n=1 Tax=Serratia grimesii TaxID=82995 RepID=A0ABR4UA59_9GAMM|nr:hypothetical protein CR62_24140 [Serratia grimesii]
MANSFKQMKNNDTLKRFNPDFSLSISHELAFMRETPEGGYVAHGDYATLFSELESLKAERDALAVENTAIKAMNDCLSEELRGYESDGAFEGPNMHHLWWKAETPATDTALTAIRLQSKIEGVEAAANRVGIVSLQYKPGQRQELIKAIGRDVLQYANELREAK